MYKLYLFLIFGLLNSSNSRDLKGTYKAFFEKKENDYVEANFDLVFLSDNHYVRKVYQFENNNDSLDEIKGSIEKVYNKKGETFYYLSDLVFIQHKVKLDSISLKLPKVIMEIKKVNSDTLKFRNTYSSQLNVTLSKGVLVKED